MLDGRLSFSSWTLADGEMGIASQVLGSCHLMFRSLSDCHPLIVGLPSEMRRITSHFSHQVFLPLVISETGKKKKLHATLFAMF